MTKSFGDPTRKPGEMPKPPEPCNFFPVEYDSSKYCNAHGGFAWHYGPNSSRCDRAPVPLTFGLARRLNPNADAILDRVLDEKAAEGQKLIDEIGVEGVLALGGPYEEDDDDR